MVAWRKKIEDPLSLAFAKSFGVSENEEKSEEPFFESVREDISILSEENKIDNNQEILIEDEKVKKDEETSDTIIPSVISPDIETGFLSSQEKLADIKKEWEEAKQRDLVVNSDNDDEGMPEPKISNDDEYSYPFGGWTNADNYNK